MLELITTFIVNNPEIIMAMLTAAFTSFGASALTIVTKTKVSLAYKVLEVIALNVGKAKDTAQGKEK